MTARVLVLVMCAVAAISTAHADDKAQAKKLYEEGLRHYNLAEYAEAIRPWKDAYLLTKRPLLLFNIGQAYRLSGDCAQAMTFYESYAREQPNPKNQGELSDAEALCREKLAAKPAPPPVTPPPMTETGTAPTPLPPPPPATAEQRPSYRRRNVGMIVGISGLALGGAAIYFALHAGKQADALDGYRGEWGAAQESIEARGRRDQKLAWGLGLGGAAAIGVGVALVMSGAGSSESSVAVVPARGGAEVSWTVRY